MLLAELVSVSVSELEVELEIELDEEEEVVVVDGVDEVEKEDEEVMGSVTVEVIVVDPVDEVVTVTTDTDEAGVGVDTAS